MAAAGLLGLLHGGAQALPVAGHPIPALRLPAGTAPGVYVVRAGTRALRLVVE